MNQYFSIQPIPQPRTIQDLHYMYPTRINNIELRRGQKISSYIDIVTKIYEIISRDNVFDEESFHLDEYNKVLSEIVNREYNSPYLIVRIFHFKVDIIIETLK